MWCVRAAGNVGTYEQHGVRAKAQWKFGGKNRLSEAFSGVFAGKNPVFGEFRVVARPEFVPTPKMRTTVKTMAGLGCRSEDIATLIGIAPKTLRKHFRAELDQGSIAANAKVMQTLFEMATSGKNTAASIFWAKTRCGMGGSKADGADEKAPQIVLKLDGELGG